MPVLTRSTDQLDTLGEARDRSDAEAIHSIFKALQPLADRGLAVVNRALREAVQKICQEPRMPKGKTGSSATTSHWTSPGRRAPATCISVPRPLRRCPR